MEFDLQTSKELDSVLNVYKKSGKQMTFVGNHSFDNISLSHEPKFYIEVLKKLGYIEYSEYGSGPIEKMNGYWNITLLGKSFKGFEKKFRIESNWFLKDNHSNLKWTIGIILTLIVAFVGWKLQWAISHSKVH